MSIIIFIISLAVLILVHEFGHFIVAKKLGIRVDEFGLGFPPKLWAKKWGETTYTLNAIPFGGFVKIFGEDPGEGGTQAGDSRSFQNKSKWAQAAVLLAGVTFNLLFAWLLIFIVSLPDGWLAFSHSLQLTLYVLKETVIGLGGFLWGIVTFHADFSQVAGIVGIAHIFSQSISEGVSQILYLVALISINLAVINLLPFPALDGGRLLFVIIEALIRRPLPPKFVNWANTIGFVLLIILMVIVTWRDIMKIL